MPLLPSGCGVDEKLTIGGQNEVDARYRKCSHLLTAQLARRRCILILDEFEWVVQQRQEEGIEVWCRCEICRH